MLGSEEGKKRSMNNRSENSLAAVAAGWAAYREHACRNTHTRSHAGVQTLWNPVTHRGHACTHVHTHVLTWVRGSPGILLQAASA